MPIPPFLREFRMFVISSSPSIPPSLSAPHTPIFRRNPSCPHSLLYQPPSVRVLLNLSRCKGGNYCHGQRLQHNGLGTMAPSRASVIPLMESTSSLDPGI